MKEFMKIDKSTYFLYQDVVNNNKDFFQDSYYHSILDMNLIKLDLMLRYGILSENQQLEKKINCLYTECRDACNCANGSDNISISYYNGREELNSLFSGFAHHVMTLPSIMINKNIETIKPKESAPAFDDELFVKDKIGKDQYKGILLPEHLLNKRISEIKPLIYNIRYAKEDYIVQWIQMIESYFNTEIDKEYLLYLCNQIKEIAMEEIDRGPHLWIGKALPIQEERLGTNIEIYMAELVEKLWDNKLNQRNTTCLDVIQQINVDKYPLYILNQQKVKKLGSQK